MSSHCRSAPSWPPHPLKLCCAVLPPLEVVAALRQVRAYRSMKYSLPERSELMSVSPPPGFGPGELWTALGTAPGLISRKVDPPSTEASHSLRWVPVPVGPLANSSLRALLN